MSRVVTLKDINKLRNKTPIRKNRHTTLQATVSSRSTSTFDEKQMSISLVDPIWEQIDPTPDIYALFAEYNKTFFNGKLSGCEVKWSTRMTSSAGLCVYDDRTGFCSIRLSLPLLKLRPRKDLVETLLHEMIHAYLFITDRDKNDHDGHGPEFQYIMHRINAKAGTNITIYHDFNDEVKYYQQHWWRCNGPCKTQPPYYGWVKRAMNRAPSKADYWWEQHRRTCGGTFIKVKEPENYAAKKGQSKGLNEKKTTLNSFFPGKGYVLGRSSSLCDMSNPVSGKCGKPVEYNAVSGMKPKQSPGRAETVKIFRKNGETKNDKKPRKKTSTNNRDYYDIIVLDDDDDDDDYIDELKFRLIGTADDDDDDLSVLVRCRVCKSYLPENDINSHLDSCVKWS